MAKRDRQRAMAPMFKRPPYLPQRVVKTQTQVIAHHRAHSGPLPDAQTLADYNSVLPGLAERIVVLAEQTAAHRRKCETAIINAQVADAQADRLERRRGQYCAFVVCLAAILVGGWVAVAGYEWAGAILGTGGLASIVTAFIWGKVTTPKAESSVPAEK